MVLEDAPLDTVLSCYRQFTHRTLLSSGALPKIRLTLQAAATNDVTAAKVLEKALADQGILSFPYGAKFLLVLAASEAETARARLPLTNSLPVSNGLESVPAGMLKLQKADFSQALALYANFVGRRWQGNSPRGIQVAPIDVFAQTELTASEAGTALEILFALRGVKVVPVGVDGLKVVALETTLNR